MDQCSKGPLRWRESVEVFHAGADLARIGPAQVPSADAKQPGNPTRQELVGPLSCREGEGAELETFTVCRCRG